MLAIAFGVNGGVIYLADTAVEENLILCDGMGLDDLLATSSSQLEVDGASGQHTRPQDRPSLVLTREQSFAQVARENQNDPVLPFRAWHVDSQEWGRRSEIVSTPPPSTTLSLAESTPSGSWDEWIQQSETLSCNPLLSMHLLPW